MSNFLIYMGAGLFAGLIAGLFGVGGGLVLVPLLVFLFAQQGFSPDYMVHAAIATSLATIVFTSLSSLYAHHRRGAVLWPVVISLSPGMMIGALCGAAIADYLPGDVLRGVFGIFELGVALYMFSEIKPSAHQNLPAWHGLGLAGILIGVISAIVGIGGGTLTVPFLVWCRVVMQKAVATAAACGLPIALAGAGGFIIAGWGHEQAVTGSMGYVYLPALVGIAAFSVLSAPLGARLAHYLPAQHLRRLFAAFLACLGLYMLFIP